MGHLVDINLFVSAIEASSGELHHDIWISIRIDVYIVNMFGWPPRY